MDKEQEQVQVLGFIDIFIESFKIILSHPKLYSKIALTFIVPLNFFVLAFFVIIELMFVEVAINSSTSYKVLTLLSYKSIIYCCIKAICVIAINVFYFLSIVAVTYSTSCIYAGKDITFLKVLSFAFQARKGLSTIIVKHMRTTYVSNFISTFSICIIATDDLGMILFGFSNQFFKTWILKIIIVILVVIGEIYMILCIHSANVITEIEDISGSKAKENSRQMMKGKYETAIAIALFFCSTSILVLAQHLVAIDSNIGLGTKILYGITSMVLNPLIIIYCWVAPTMLYFVSKTYHGETIDISSSSNDCLNGDYVALESEGEKIDKLDV